MSLIPKNTNYIFLIILSKCLFSAYLTNISVVLIQPDNSKLHCFTSGDEYYSWLHNENGIPVSQKTFIEKIVLLK